MEACLLVFVLVIVPLIYLTIAISTLKNYDQIKTKQGDAYEKYGIMMKEIDTVKIKNKYIAVLSSLEQPIRSYFIAYLLCFHIKHPIFQIFAIYFAPFIQLIWILHFNVYGKGTIV